MEPITDVQDTVQSPRLFLVSTTKLLVQQAQQPEHQKPTAGHSKEVATLGAEINFCV